MIDLTGGPCVYKRLSGCGSGTEYLAVTPWDDFYPCHQFVGEEEYLMGNVDEGITKPEIQKEFGGCNVYTKKTAKTASHVSTAAADVQQMHIISREISKAIMKSDANSRENVWSAPS